MLLSVLIVSWSCGVLPMRLLYHTRRTKKTFRKEHKTMIRIIGIILIIFFVAQFIPAILLGISMFISFILAFVDIETLVVFGIFGIGLIGIVIYALVNG
jgi:polyferredoxin